MDALVVVIDRHRQGAFCGILTDHIIMQIAVNLARSGEFLDLFGLRLLCFLPFLMQNLVA